MRILGYVVLSAAACAGPRAVTTPTAPTTPPVTTPDTTWAVTTACNTPRSTGGFGRVLGAADRLVVYPDAEQDTAAYFMKEGGFEGRRVSELRPGDRERDLLVLGTLDNNPLIQQLNGSLPVFFEHGRFTFGGYRYDGRADGIVLIHPNPFAAGHFIVLYAGNSHDGVDTTQSVPTGGHDFETVAMPAGIQQEGELCEDGARWKFHAAFATDGRREWETYRARLERHETAHNILYWEPGSPAARDAAHLLAEVEADHQHILDVLHVAEPDHKITTYYWSDRATKGKLTGDDGNGHSMFDVVHVLYSADVHGSGAHEYVHAIASARLAPSTQTLLVEGLAVMVSDFWLSESLEDAVAGLRKRGMLAPLSLLATKFRDVDDHVSYPIAGHFVKFLVAHYGIDKVKALYGAADLTTAVPQTLGIRFDQLEADWLATIPQ